MEVASTSSGPREISGSARATCTPSVFLDSPSNAILPVSSVRNPRARRQGSVSVKRASSLTPGCSSTASIASGFSAFSASAARTARAAEAGIFKTTSRNTSSARNGWNPPMMKAMAEMMAILMGGVRHGECPEI